MAILIPPTAIEPLMALTGAGGANAIAVTVDDPRTVREAAFLTLQTSPGNHHAWICRFWPCRSSRGQGLRPAPSERNRRSSDRKRCHTRCRYRQLQAQIRASLPYSRNPHCHTRVHHGTGATEGARMGSAARASGRSAGDTPSSFTRPRISAPRQEVARRCPLPVIGNAQSQRHRSRCQPRRLYMVPHSTRLGIWSVGNRRQAGKSQRQGEREWGALRQPHGAKRSQSRRTQRPRQGADTCGCNSYPFRYTPASQAATQKGEIMPKSPANRPVATFKQGGLEVSVGKNQTKSSDL